MSDTGHDNYGDNRQATREQFDALRSALARSQDLTEGAIVERDNANRDSAVLRNELLALNANVMALSDMVDELQRKEVDRLTRENASLREHVSVLQNEVHEGHCLYVEVRDESVDRQRRLDAVKALPRECSDTMPQGIVRGELLDIAIETAIPLRDVFDRLHPSGTKASVRCVSCQRNIPWEEQPHICR